jgi:hypothetical protein
MVEDLLSMLKALCFIPSATKKAILRRADMVSHYHFDLYFPDGSLYWAFFSNIGQLCVFF